MSRRGRVLWVVLPALLAGWAAAAPAQQAGAAGAAQPVADAASPPLPPDHWARAAVRRADGLGLVPVALPSRTGVSREAVGEALWAAAASAAGDPELSALTAAWQARFVVEFPEVGRAAAEAPGLRLLGSAAGAGAAAHRGRVAPGLGEAPDHTGPLPLPDRAEVGIGGELAAGAGAHVAGVVEPWIGSGVEVPRWDLVLAAGGVQLAVGRQPVGFGGAAGGGVVLSGLEPLERLELATRRARRIPGWLRVLGPASFQAFFARLPEGRHPGDPVLLGATASLQPHPRLQLALHRAAMVGGDRTEEPVHLETLLLAMVGKHAGIEDQIVSGEARLRLPTERWLPLTVYCEVGAEDSAGAVTAVPGFLCGGFAPALPALPALALGAEVVHFGAVCCGNPPWYRHWMFRGSWSGAEQALGHPLGGRGTEWLAYGQWSSPAAALLLDGRAFARERSGENLFVPGREGASQGARLALDWRTGPSTGLRMGGGVEEGEGWREYHLEIGARILFD